MSNTRHNSSRLPLRSGFAAVLAALSLLLAACSSPAASNSAPSTTSTSTSSTPSGGTAQADSTTPTAPPLTGQVIAPGDVASIVASDTAINNRANASLSIPLQDSHETCLQQILDDATYSGDRAAGSNTLGGSFDQVPGRAFVPRETGYPAFFSVLAEDRASSQPTTNNLLTYVKTSPSARWKLASSSEILGPTNQGVALPAAATDAEGYVTSLDAAASDGLVTAPDKVAARVAAAFSSEATSGRLPAGISAQFGPKNVADPHSIAASYAGVGTVTVQFTATTPAAAAAGEPSRDCPYPAIRLADGGALVTFAIFEKVVVQVRTGKVVVQPSDRSALGVLLPPGTYSSITMFAGDMEVAVVPPSGSRSPIEVIGQASEGLTETGVPGSGSSGSSGSGGLVNASSIAKRVDLGLVDINTTLNYENEEAAGTGMVLSPNGEILTNNHVIEGATSISVTDVGNGRTYGAKFVGYDRTSDVAVLRLENASGLHTVSLGNFSSVRTGEAVVGIGNAGGSGGTPSYAGGSITALDQSITASDQGDGTSENLTGLIETDADIQPGDSGGPLVNSGGKVIGMDTAASAGYSFEQGGYLTTQGFSIPINTALRIANEITAGDSSSTVHVGPTAFLGVNVISPGSGAFGFGHGGFGFGQPVPAPTSSGAEIESVVSGSPASQAAIVEGDTIISLGGQSVSSPDSLTRIIESEKPGVSVPLVYLDPSGAQQTVSVRLVSGPPQ
jgi:S1-C subfamily serine protease